MALLEKQLIVKRSLIEGAGKGLFTKEFIAKGKVIIEYKGKVRTWKEILNDKDFNAYVYYINRNHVIDAKPFKKFIARYTNDARGITKTKGVNNNSSYKQEKGKVFVVATKNIKAGEEILVSYGKEYWDAIRYNIKLENKVTVK